MESPERLFPLSAAGREVGLSKDWLRILCDRGAIACERDATGRRLIPEREIRRLQKERAKTAASLSTPVRDRLGAGGNAK